jgi:hypothetical protein
MSSGKFSRTFRFYPKELIVKTFILNGSADNISLVLSKKSLSQNKLCVSWPFLPRTKQTEIYQRNVILLMYVHGVIPANHFAAYRCCCLPCMGMHDGATVVSDNCCQCNYAALRRMVEIGEVEVIYATYHVDVGETPFFVAVDFTRHKIVISIRGTLSMKVGIMYALHNCICTIFVLFLNF